jgi:hypothetical protein
MFEGDQQTARCVSSLYELDKRYKNQGGCCAICRKPLKIGGCESDSTHLDHCHISGETRGILCKACNFILGQYQDSPEKLRETAKELQEGQSTATAFGKNPETFLRAARYLELHRKHSAWWIKYLKVMSQPIEDLV